MFGLISQAGKEEEQKVDESTPWMAAGDGDLKLLQRALSTLGLNAGAQDHNGYSLAHAASSYGHVEVLKWLVTQSECGMFHYEHFNRIRGTLRLNLFCMAER